MISMLKNVKNKIAETVLTPIRTRGYKVINDIPGASGDIKPTIKGGFDEILDNSGSVYYALNITKMTCVIHTAKVKSKIIGIINSIKVKIENPEHKQILIDLIAELYKYPDADIQIGKEEIDEIRKNTGGKRKTKKKYKNAKQRRMIGGEEGLKRLLSLLKDTASKLGTSSLGTSSSGTSSSTTSPRSVTITGSALPISQPSSIGASHGGAGPYSFTITGENMPKDKMDELNGKICRMISDALNSKLNDFEVDLGNIAMNATKYAEEKLATKILAIINNGLETELKQFYAKVNDDSSTDELIDRIIGDFGLKLRDGWQGRRDEAYFEDYVRFLQLIDGKLKTDELDKLKAELDKLKASKKKIDGGQRKTIKNKTKKKKQVKPKTKTKPKTQT